MGGKVLDLDIIKAHDAGIEQGREQSKISDIKSLMKNLKLSAEQAMEALGIDKGDFSKYMPML